MNSRTNFENYYCLKIIMTRKNCKYFQEIFEHMKITVSLIPSKMYEIQNTELLTN